MKEYVENMTEFAGNMSMYLDLALPHLYMGLGPVKNSEHRLHIVCGTWRNFDFSPFIWGLGLQAVPLYRRILALGLGKIPRPSFLLDSGT
mgnify:CR=1 FL=1